MSSSDQASWNQPSGIGNGNRVTGRLFVLSFVLATTIMACGGAQTPEPTSVALRTRLGTLPPLPFQLAASSTGFRRLFEGVEEALRDELPEPDVENERAYRRWVEVELHDWLDRRGTAIRAASNRVRSLASGTDQEAGVAEGIVAYLLERTVESVVSAPVPNESSDPDRARVLRDAWRQSMDPMRRSALEHWAACAQAFTLASPEDAEWKARCDDESEGVVAPEPPEDEPEPVDPDDEADE